MPKKVININGTSEDLCGCGSWLNHWEKYGGIKAGVCAEHSCSKAAEFGTCVLKADNTADRNWYIVPLCKDHDALWGKEIEIRNSAKMVSANTKETCAKE